MTITARSICPISMHAINHPQVRESARGIMQGGSLSAREAQVLKHVSRGCSNQEIASQLSITVGTTKGHLHRIFTKLKVRNRTAAVARARDIGLL